MGNFLKTLSCCVCFFCTHSEQSFPIFLQLTWICHVSFLHLCLWHFFLFLLILSLEGLGTIHVSHVAGYFFSESHKTPAPWKLYLAPGLLFYFLDFFFQLNPSFPITMATNIHLLLEAFSNCPSRLRPPFSCGIALCSVSFYSGWHIVIRNLQWAGNCTRLRM